MSMHPAELKHAYCLLNHGPTVLVSGHFYAIGEPVNALPLANA
jgi:hypothetical protein